MELEATTTGLQEFGGTASLRIASKRSPVFCSRARVTFLRMPLRSHPCGDRGMKNWGRRRLIFPASSWVVVTDSRIYSVLAIVQAKRHPTCSHHAPPPTPAHPRQPRPPTLAHPNRPPPILALPAYPSPPLPLQPADAVPLRPPRPHSLSNPLQPPLHTLSISVPPTQPTPLLAPLAVSKSDMMSAKYSRQERVMTSRGQRWGRELVGRVTAGQEERQRSSQAEPDKSWEVMGQGGTGVGAEERGEWKTK